MTQGAYLSTSCLSEPFPQDTDRSISTFTWVYDMRLVRSGPLCFSLHLIGRRLALGLVPMFLSMGCSSVQIVDETFTSDSGLTAKVALVVPEQTNGSAPPGVLLFFTEDFGNNGYRKQARLHAEVAQAHGLLLVSMASPDAPGDEGCWWAPQVKDNAAYVDEFLQVRLIGDLGVDPNRVFTTGLSGGSDFAAAFHLHTGYRYSGGVVALCGGDIPRLNGGGCDPEKDPEPAPAPTGLSAADLSRVRYDFAITADDSLLPNSQAAAAFYTELGFTRVRHRIVEGSGHCGFESGWEGLDVLEEGMNYVDP